MEIRVEVSILPEMEPSTKEEGLAAVVVIVLIIPLFLYPKNISRAVNIPVSRDMAITPGIRYERYSD